jgi:hypothetical protein
MFYAIVDRRRHALTLNNGCPVLEDTGEAYYYFSVSRNALARRPWRIGYLYSCPRIRSTSSPETATPGIRHACGNSRARSP